MYDPLGKMVSKIDQSSSRSVSDARLDVPFSNLTMHPLLERSWRSKNSSRSRTCLAQSHQKDSSVLAPRRDTRSLERWSKELFLLTTDKRTALLTYIDSSSHPFVLHIKTNAYLNKYRYRRFDHDVAAPFTDERDCSGSCIRRKKRFFSSSKNKLQINTVEDKNKLQTMIWKQMAWRKTRKERKNKDWTFF